MDGVLLYSIKMPVSTAGPDTAAVGALSVVPVAGERIAFAKAATPVGPRQTSTADVFFVLAVPMLHEIAPVSVPSIVRV